MPRLSLTLDTATIEAIKRHARRGHLTLAAAARELLGEAIVRLRKRERRHPVAADYAAGRKDARRTLASIEGGQADLLDGHD